MDDFQQQYGQDQNGNAPGYPAGNGYRAPYPPRQKNGFANAALVLGICSMALCITVLLPFPLGALGILFVILSRRRGEKLSSKAWGGLITSLFGMVLGLLLMGTVAVASLKMLKPENREQLNQQFEQIYGIDFDEYLERLTQDSFDL